MQDETEVYKIYSRQVSSLLQLRGLNYDEIEGLLSVYQENDIRSDEKVAQVLGMLYPESEGIIIVFYYFCNDTLRRVVFEPGTVKEKRYFPASRKELLQLSADFNHLLGLYKGTDNRMPVKRGVIFKPPPATKGLTYDSLIRKSTKLLLPEWFDTSYRHVIFIPALNLSTLPFHLLQPFGDKSVLIDRCSFTVAPTVGDLIALRMKVLKQNTSWSGRLQYPFSDEDAFQLKRPASFTLKNPLFISNPEYPTSTGYSFPDLPGAKKEIANAIPFAKKFTLLEGKTAIKDSVMKYMGTSDVAYFATHGIASEDEPMKKSFLVLSGSDPFLTAKDIMDSRKKFYQFPGMVILSACQTGLGKSMEVGVAGLARAFMLAGANHIIMSLWNVDDEATAYLMNRFMFHLQEPSLFMPAEQLRKALLDTRKKYSKPSQWASFSLFGVDY
jgi:CHAT domain-containing protein